MGNKHREANKAYNKARKSGATKEEAKVVSEKVIQKWDDHFTGRKPFKGPGSTTSREDSSGWDFDSDLNSNGTDWHTADDL